MSVLDQVDVGSRRVFERALRAGLRNWRPSIENALIRSDLFFSLPPLSHAIAYTCCRAAGAGEAGCGGQRPSQAAREFCFSPRSVLMLEFHSLCCFFRFLNLSSFCDDVRTHFSRGAIVNRTKSC